MMDKIEIRRARMSLGLTQKQAADLFGLTPAGYNRIETGRRNVPVYIDLLLFACNANEDIFNRLKDRRGVDAEVVPG